MPERILTNETTLDFVAVAELSDKYKLPPTCKTNHKHKM